MQSLARSLARSLAFAALPLLLSGCGGSDEGGGTNPMSFLGTWSYTSGTLTATCTGLTPPPVPLTGSITVTAGSASDLVLTDAYCTVTLDVSGTTASAAPAGQNCASTIAVGAASAMVTGTYSTFVFSTSDGKTGHISATLAGMAAVGSLTFPCTVTEAADLQKL